MRRPLRLPATVVAVSVAIAALVALPALPSELSSQPQPDPLSIPFVGVTNDGTLQPNLFTVRSSGVSTAGVRDGSQQFLRALTTEQRTIGSFASDDIE